MPRNRVIQTLSFNDRCIALAQAKRAAAAKLDLGPEREQLERSALELENAPRIESWLTSVGLQPPN